MRITKVKNSKDTSLIEIRRTTAGGELKNDKYTYSKQEEIEGELEKRDKDFNLSIEMKTLSKLRKSSTQVKNCMKVIQRIIKNVLKGNFDFKKGIFNKASFDDKDIEECLLSRWRGEYRYVNTQGESKTVHLVEALSKCFKKPGLISQYMKDYIEWSKYFKESKISHLARSVKGNLVQNEGASLDSLRAQSLKIWARELVENHEIYTEELEIDFQLGAFIEQLKSVIAEIPEDKKSSFSIAVTIKQRYREHCYELHKNRVKNGIEENVLQKQYRLEVSKYLDICFPLKTKNASGKNAKKNETKSRKSITLETAFKKLEDTRYTVQKRIKNSTLQYIIHTGKQYYYGETRSSSEQLMLIRAKEDLSRQFIKTCAFASTNLRIAMNPNLEKDILSVKHFCDSINICLPRRKKTWNHLRLFFELSEESKTKRLLDDMSCGDIDFIQNLTPLRGAINNVRHSVVHFEKNILQTLFRADSDVKKDKHSFEQFSYVPKLVDKDKKYDTGSINQRFVDTPYKDLLEAELHQLPQLCKEQLRSTRILEFYEYTDIEKILAHRTLVSRNLPFTPSFNKVFSLGRKLQNEAENPYDTNSYFAHLAENESACLARRNLLRLIYETIFIAQFLDSNNAKEFGLAVKNVLDTNKNQAKQSRSSFKFAFEQVPLFHLGMNPKAYLSDIQSRLMQEEFVKRDSGKLTDTETGNFQKFLFYLFMKGFDKFLDSYPFAKDDNMPQARFAESDSQRKQKLDKELSDIQIPQMSHSINHENSVHIYIWCFAKLLDQSHISELNNQLLKYRHYSEKLAEEYPRLKEEIGEECNILIEILALCRLSCEKYHSSNAEQQRKLLEHYVDARCLDRAPYVQEDGSTPVLFATVQLVRRYATDSILKPLLEKYRVTPQDIKNWEHAKISIAEDVQKRRKMHKELSKSKKLSQNELDDYKKLQEKIDAFNWLDNKVNLVHVIKLHHLIIEILGRMASYVNLFERNLRFCHEFIINIKDTLISQSYTPCDWSSGIPHALYKRDFKSHDTNWVDFIECALMGCRKINYNKSGNPISPIAIRNPIAHFNYLGKPNYDLLHTMMKLRNLMSHDRKLANAVIPSVIKILDRHGITLKLDSENVHAKKAIIVSCKSKTVKHLKKINIDFASQEYVEMVCDLLKFRIK